jgi:beta-glucosidase-like glycosyl hydrolase
VFDCSILTADAVAAEDPYLTGEYGSYIVQGTQQSPIDDRYLAAAVTMKHFQLYDYEGYQPNHGDAGLPPDASCDNDSPGPHCGRGTFDSRPPARDFAGYYMQAFKTVAQRGAPAAVRSAQLQLSCSIFPALSSPAPTTSSMR